MKITVAAGGLSPERDVSLSSGALIANALAAAGHLVALIDVYAGIDESVPAGSLFTSRTDHAYTVPKTEPDLARIKQTYHPGDDALIGRGVLEVCAASDVVFMALHGAMGENGQFQATLDTHGIRYTGSGYDGSLLAMDKDISKRLMRSFGIPTADWIYFPENETPSKERILDEIGLPCVLKPCRCGSSCGVSIVDKPEQLDAALKYAAQYNDALLCEKKACGREFSVGVLTSAALPVIEIIPKTGFYDYANKYQSGAATEITPADLTPEQTARVQSYALRVHEILRLGTYSRSDFILDRCSGEFICLEVNSAPGMTPTSLVPKEAAAAGIGYGELCELIVKNAFRNENRRG